MKEYFKYFISTSVAILITVALLLLVIMDTRAQSHEPQLQKAPGTVSIDGSIKEWGDSLALYDAKTKLNYTVAADDTNLYVVVFSGNRQTTHKIMAAGITVSVNPDGKKSKKYSLTYPLPNKSSLFKRPAQGGDDNDGPANPPSLIQSTSIKVEGFKDVESDVITTANTYGFKAAVKFDDKHNLGYEVAIPLKFLNLKPGKNKEFAINISVNGITRPQQQNRRGEGGGTEGIGGSGGFGSGGMSAGRMGGGRGSRRMGGGEQSPQDQSGMSQTEDFWIKVAAPSH
jgi:uncharacterized membrane protein YgcG